MENERNFNGSRQEWYKTGLDLLNSKAASKYYSLETFGVQKRRMKNKLSGQYYGPYYDTQSWNIRVTDKALLEYADLNRIMISVYRQHCLYFLIVNAINFSCAFNQFIFTSFIAFVRVANLSQ